MANSVVVPPVLGLRGDGCDDHCASGLACAPLPGGYCASACGVTGTSCDGTCVETGRGELCLKSCTSDSACRADEGYVCDPVWHACSIPNLAAIAPANCPVTGPVTDKSFATSLPWSTAETGPYQVEPSAVIGSDGNAVAIYASLGAIGAGNVLAVSNTAAPPIGLEHNVDPQLAHDRAGKLYAVWHAFDDDHDEILLASSSDRGATWHAPIEVQEPGDCTTVPCVDRPLIAIGPDPGQRTRDLIYVMYGAGGGLRVRASHDGGVTFGRAVTALGGDYGNAAIGTDGRLHLVALSDSTGGYGSAQHHIAYTVSADGGASFTKPLVVSGRDELIPGFFANPSIAVDDRRRLVHFAYARGGRAGSWDLVVATTNGKTWTRARIGDDCALYMVPNLAVDSMTGVLHVAWYDSTGGGRFAHASCLGGKCTQLGAINTVPFAALSTGRYGSRWVGDYESLVIDDKRRVLHAVWAQPVAEGDAIVSRIFHAQAKLR